MPRKERWTKLVCVVLTKLLKLRSLFKKSPVLVGAEPCGGAPDPPELRGESERNLISASHSHKKQTRPNFARARTRTTFSRCSINNPLLSNAAYIDPVSICWKWPEDFHTCLGFHDTSFCSYSAPCALRHFVLMT